MADDDDVDMSLFFTIVMKNMSAIAIAILDNVESSAITPAQVVMDFAYPMLTVV